MKPFTMKAFDEMVSVAENVGVIGAQMKGRGMGGSGMMNILMLTPERAKILRNPMGWYNNRLRRRLSKRRNRK